MVKFSQTNINFGDCIFGERVTKDITVTNPSQEDIVLTAHVSCGSCTYVTITPNPIPAGKDGNIQVLIDTKKAGMGDITKTVKFTWFSKGVNYSELFIIKLNVSRS